MICCAVIDTNVLVSALLSSHDDAATVQVVSRMFKGEIVPIYSRQIICEYQEVLSRRKFHFTQSKVDFLISAIERFGIFVTPSPTGAVLPDRKDLPFYEVVMEKRDSDAHLVTGNLKHFPAETFIVTPRQMLNILDGIEN